MLRQSAREAQQRTGLSGAQLFVLQQLRAAGGALTPGELARRTLTHQSSVSVVVRRLVDKGFVSRARSASDARRIELTLTAAGRKTARRVPRLAQERLIEAVDGLPPAARAGLASGLAALVDRLGLRDAAAPMFFEEGAGGAQ
jgi:DNA-binding MarR family transcriptional regulator